ncbi:hybrid sensor histidine kinase/response regulator [Nocardioides sp. ChNu-153]|uniref:hybrid sensor histidine kinase/response regulator n=1 Tax=unclassified Nocardioides TaxID=2615069 RepID=UPI002406B926|nr:MULTISPECIES: hybrid sensor histidine kinase/response regulator [unclassified Nocardioides]MDF9717499.1 hybrid sensor histidine kinase/response regulator [Nocardioides sp. ChNu-99]MDN7122090.1 hybrid sensor histidine kinase/response regulator [Nocardioides sp. ChNu-153]
MRTLEPPVPPADPEASPRPARVVVVDDTPDLRNLLRLMLTRGGFEIVGEAVDGLDALAVVGRTQPDVVLLDIAMPRMDGIEALPQLRRASPGARIVAMSAFGAAHMANRAVAAGADGYVEKGTSLHSILTYVRELAGDPERPTRPLAVTSAATGLATSTPLRPATTPAVRPAPVTNADLATLAFDHAPYGILVVSDEPAPRVIASNAAARGVVDVPLSPGGLLGLTAPELAQAVADHRHHDHVELQVAVGAGSVHVTVRRTEAGVLVYLDATDEELGMLRRAIATAAHELRGPISAIDGAVDVLGWGGDPLPEEERTRLLRTVVRQVQQLDRVTSDLYTATQVHLGTLHVDPRPTVIGALVQELLAHADDVTVDVTSDRAAMADPLRVEQMLGNLLSNAGKYGAPPCTVVVRDGRSGTVRIEVVDRGPGVPAELEPHLFREFTRGSGAVARGTGLGLWIVRTLAEAQGGSVAYRRHPEGGSIFTVQLPTA